MELEVSCWIMQKRYNASTSTSDATVFFSIYILVISPLLIQVYDNHYLLEIFVHLYAFKVTRNNF